VEPDHQGSRGRCADPCGGVFDKGSHTFRNDLYDLYKANRDEMPEDLRPQIPLTRDATRAFNIACLELEGFEADDIIATLARQAREAGGRVTIISSDKDLMQLVGGGVEMFDAMKNRASTPRGWRRSSASGPTGWSTCRRWPATASTTCPARRGSGSRRRRF
jgi:DNA polymerase-1